MPNYWGGEFGSYDDNKDTKVTFPEPDDQIKEGLGAEVEVSSDSEKRLESLQVARESVINGSYLHIIDRVDVSECDCHEVGEGLYEIVYQGNIVGYAKDMISKSDQSLRLN